MDIAIIGWGSLIWNPDGLAIKSRWHRDGPGLPIDFSRVSDNRCLTLVIDPAAHVVRTYWAASECVTVEDAREDLRRRERTPNIGNIHGVVVGRADELPGLQDTKQIVRAWLFEKQLDAALWTGLGPKTTAEAEVVFDPIHYLRSLCGAELERAREYICKAPPQIVTPVRLRIEQELGWARVPLNSDLFE
ncbi:MAG TPA: hypothetical protein VKT78_00325 [Fimbriimonadaceae bacterium]|nr:hypothetical protein [Fimbriimonadaceae bacterium]